MDSVKRPFEIYPAIDLRNGQVVRLAQGDLNRTTVYSSAPAEMARRWQSAGATWAHVVNLDGAFGELSISNPSTSLRTSLQSLISILSTGLSVQFGGGLRNMENIRHVFGLGVNRVVIGTAAVETPALIDQALTEFGADRIAVGVDAREGRVRVRGWETETATTVVKLGRRLRRQGVRIVIFTDVARDGIGAGVNVASSVELMRASGLEVIASGGVAGIEDVRRVHEAGLAGLIIGRALYEGQIDLVEAMRVCL
jgi:phosphoribosylformimino-5-aminoimidazole carboxamide ribotide isomerase